MLQLRLNSFIEFTDHPRDVNGMLSAFRLETLELLDNLHHTRREHYGGTLSLGIVKIFTLNSNNVIASMPVRSVQIAAF